MRFLSYMILTTLILTPSANALEACPADQVREVKEIVVKPSIIEDVYGQVETIASNSSRERRTPAITKWVDIPENYVRPETVTSTFLYKFAPTYKPVYERHLFREASYNLVTDIEGKVSKSRVPAIWIYRPKYVIDPASASSRVETKTFPYDPAVMEKNGKLVQIIEPPSIELLNSSWIRKLTEITHQTRTPAVIKQVWGDCILRE